MNQHDVEKFKSQLLTLQAELAGLESLSKDSTATVELDQSSVGRLSRMDALQGQQMALEAGRRRKQELQRIRAALDRIENGEFGYCLSCGDEIALGRLAINPATNHCVRCSD